MEPNKKNQSDQHRNLPDSSGQNLASGDVPARGGQRDGGGSVPTASHAPASSQQESLEAGQIAPRSSGDAETARPGDRDGGLVHGTPGSTPESAATDRHASGGGRTETTTPSAANGTALWRWLLQRLTAAALVLMCIAGGLFAIGLAQRMGWIVAAGGSGEAGSAGDGGTTSAAKRYVCPMMCVPPTTQPGRCPVCGMELVEAAADTTSDGKTIVIDPAARRMIGIRTAVVKRQKVDRTIRTIGTIEFDQSKLATIAAYVDGRLERLYADYVGVPVQEGDDLALLYSPDLYTAMVEYFTAIERSQASRLLDQSRLVMLAEEKLRELGLTEEQIEEIRRSGQIQARIRIKSPQRGTVIEKPVVEGDYVKTGQTIYRVADLSTVWLMLDLFPDDASAIRFGQEVEAELDSAPGIVFTGRVAFIDPTVNPRTRTIRVRVEMLNLDDRLRPGDYATARVRVPAIPRDVVYDPALAGKYISPMHPQIIRDAPGKCPICDMDLIPTSQLGFSDTPLPDETVITVPRKAVLMAGGNSVVYVETEPGRFEVRRVTIAALTDDLAIIAGGLKPGEIVATDGNFLIDSQSQLAGNPSLLDPSKAPEYPPGPLELPEVLPVVLSGAAGQMLDSAAQAYFEIQAALAADAEAPRVAVNQLIQALSQVAASGAIRDAELLQDLQTSLDAAEHLPLSLDTARLALRRISHGMLRVLNRYRGPQTAVSLFHFYCPMVPGGGGDWMQADPELKNPYWGSQMLTCGELVRNMGQTSSQSVDVLPTIANPFDGMPLQTLEAGDDGDGNAATPHDR